MEIIPKKNLNVLENFIFLYIILLILKLFPLAAFTTFSKPTTVNRFPVNEIFNSSKLIFYEWHKLKFTFFHERPASFEKYTFVLFANISSTLPKDKLGHDFPYETEIIKYQLHSGDYKERKKPL